jgi:hypothetical protein
VGRRYGGVPGEILQRCAGWRSWETQCIAGDAGSSSRRYVGIDPSIVNIQKAEEIAPAIEKLKGRVNALYVCATPFINTNRSGISSAALAAGLPTMRGFREAVDSGGLMSYGPNFPDLFRRAAHLAGKRRG